MGRSEQYFAKDDTRRTESFFCIRAFHDNGIELSNARMA
jgi:hypothetical protein